MKRYILINGTSYLFFRRESIELAHEFAINVSNHSKTIHLHEVKNMNMNEE